MLTTFCEHFIYKFIGIVVNMFMLSFIFVIVCGLIEGKRICAGFFYRLFIFVLPLEIQLSRRGEGCDPINRLNPATFLCLFQARTWIFNDKYRDLFLSVQWVMLR